MTSLITCPKCSGEFALPAELRGKIVRCPTCLSVYKPPGDSTPDEAPAVNGPGWLTFAATTLFLFGFSVLALIFVKYHRDRSAEDGGRVRSVQRDLEAVQRDLETARDDSQTLIRARDSAATAARAELAALRARHGETEKALRTQLAEAEAAARKADARLRALTRLHVIEKYLHTATLPAGIEALRQDLTKDPADDHLRFGLGALQFFWAVEKLGQAFYRYGVRSEGTNIPFLRLPLPKNPDPEPVTYEQLRNVFEVFTEDLAEAEATLAGIRDEGVQLPLRLAGVRLDFTGGAAPPESIVPLLIRFLGGNGPEFLVGNPDFLVVFDRGDVAWLRSYCHLLSAALDLFLAFELQSIFDDNSSKLFARPTITKRENLDTLNLYLKGIPIRDPARLRSFRRHVLAACELNRETWRFIRAENDDDHEWLPNAKQKGVLGVRVSDAMVDGWLAMMAEIEGLMKGEKVLGIWNPRAGDETFGLNVKALLEDPPARFYPLQFRDGAVDIKYKSRIAGGNAFDTDKLSRVSLLFEGLGMRGYLLFN